MNGPTSAEIATSFALWQEFVDPNGLMSEFDFNAMNVEERENFITDCFGEEEEDQ